ncbi:MAG TPA: glycosyltransferase [Balneolales bacterium]|nr:glycosyltransferase [Balneolales bacterium]
MRGLYIIFDDLRDYSGVSNKIIYQVSAFRKQGIEMDLSYLTVDNEHYYNGRKINNNIIDKYKDTLVLKKRWMYRFKFSELLKYIKQSNASFVYIRYANFANPFFIKFLKEINNIGLYVVMEIPTYPYDYEYVNVSKLVFIAKKIEEYYRRYFGKYVDLMVTYSNERKIFNVDTVKINNGIQLESIRIKEAVKKNDNQIHFIAVASMYFWHGYDRLIKGLKMYYSSAHDKKVFFHLVGDSDNKESKKYRYLVHKYNLDKYVIFHGYKKNEELDELFNISDLAIGCLGVHRKNITYIKSLKNSEYCARGIPFIYSETDDFFDYRPFVYKVKPNDDAIDINELLSFTESKAFDPYQIRKFAEENLTWDIQIKKIIKAMPLKIGE